MNNLPVGMQISTIILIVLGMGSLVYAIVNIRKMFKFKLEARLARFWQGLFILIIFFLIGYMASLVLVAIGLSSIIVIAAGIIFFIGAVFVYLVSSLSYSTIKGQIQTSEELKKTSDELRIVSTDLQHQKNTLELQITARTQELEHRIKQLNAISEVANVIDRVQDINEILPLVTRLIYSNFGFYHVAIFLIDENGKYAVLKAANSQAGQKMLERGHRLEVGQVGIIGYVSERGEPRISLNVSEDADYIHNPDLPNTHSEMALPLMAGKKVIGVLDMQSEYVSGFSERDLEIMRTLADQIAIAIENARAFSETREALNEAQAIYRQFLHQEWNRIATEEQTMGYRYSLSGIEPITENTMEIKNEEDELDKEGNKEINLNSLSIPVKLHNETIGFLKIRFLDPVKKWTENEKLLVQAVTDRVAISMENARLIEETSRRADRERTITEITTKIRSTTDPQSMLRTALEELKKALGTDEIQIRPLVSSPIDNRTPEKGI